MLLLDALLLAKLFLFLVTELALVEVTSLLLFLAADPIWLLGNGFSSSKVSVVTSDISPTKGVM